VQDLYRDFDTQTWWWLPEKRNESVLLGLLSVSDVLAAQKLMAAYEQNLVATTRSIDAEWHLLANTAYIPTGPAVARLVKTTNRECKRLREERDLVVSKHINVMFARRRDSL
jgi:hypothetical protein